MDTVSCCCYLLQFSNNVIIITKIFYWFGWKIFKSLETKNIWYGAWCDQLGVWWLTEAVYNQCLCTLPGDCTGATIAATLIPTVTEHLDTVDTPLRPSLPQHYIIIQPIVQPYPSHLAAYVWWTILSPQSPPNHNTTRAIIHHHIPPKQYIYQLFLYLPHSCTCCILQMQL